jgi:hypothetical protein
MEGGPARTHVVERVVLASGGRDDPDSIRTLVVACPKPMAEPVCKQIMIGIVDVLKE